MKCMGATWEIYGIWENIGNILGTYWENIGKVRDGIGSQLR
jgi:hypothetical protein